MTSALLGRRERAKADKRARILAAARSRLDSGGYDGMTMAQVAADADVAVGTVFQYAATKAELLMMVVADRFAGTVSAAVASAGRRAAPATLVRRLLEPLAADAAADPETSAAIARELLFGAEGPHRARVIETVAELESAIAGVISGGDPTPQSQVAARLIVSGSLLELNRTRTGRAPRASTEQRLTELVELVLAGATALTPPPQG